MIKNICIMAWCLWVCIMTPIAMVTSDSIEDALVVFIAGLFMFAVPAHWLEPQEINMSAIVEDIRTQWERGISVHVIAKKYSCEPIDIMRILGIWE